MKNKQDAPDIFAEESDWREYLQNLRDSDKQIQLLQRAKFIQQYLKMLRFNSEIQNKTDEAIKYDRLRQNYDIRNKPESELAMYQRSQVRMIQEDNYNG